MTTFYFTFGSDGHDYVGGWTEITVPDRDGKPNFNAAVEIFNALHPPKGDYGTVDCGGIYTYEQFQKSTMSKEGNFGHFCHERVTVEVFK